VTKVEFQALFCRALDVAAERAEARLNQFVPRRFDIKFRDATANAPPVSVDDAVGILYLGPDRFYRIVDLAVEQVLKDRCVVFAMRSGHPPASFSEIWNQPMGSGPFKQVDAFKIHVDRDAV
jgi:hypothetical protein